MHIALDLDDVILAFSDGVRQAVAKEYGVPVPDFDEWDLHKVLDPIIGRSWWKWMRDRDWIWKTFPAIDGAIGTIAQLRAEGHYIEIVTSKPAWGEASTWQWLGRWRPSVQRVTIVDKSDVKADFTDAQLMLDDKASNLKPFVDSERYGLLYSQPHNANVTLPRGVVRVTGWPAARAEITRLAATDVVS